MLFLNIVQCATWAIVWAASTNTVDASFTNKIVISDSRWVHVCISGELKIKDHEKLMHVSKGRAVFFESIIY